MNRAKVTHFSLLSEMTKFASMIDTSMIVKWFRDFALERRVGHVIYCVEHGEWPVGKSYSAYTGCLGIDLDIPLHETIKRIIPVDGAGSDSRRSASSTPDVITITTDHAGAKQISQAALSAQTAAAAAAALSAVGLGGSGSGSGSLQGLSQSQMAAAASAAAAAAAGVSLSSSKKRKRHIAIDVETERAKLHALLNNTQSPGKHNQLAFLILFFSFKFPWELVRMTWPPQHSKFHPRPILTSLPPDTKFPN